MFFCPQCNYALDITKTLPQTETGTTKQLVPQQIISNINEFVTNVLKKPEELNNASLGFQVNSLTSNAKYKKLSKQNQELVLSKFNEITNKTSGKHGVYFICKYCGYSSPIKKGTIIYNKNISKEQQVTSLENYDLKCIDPTLPRTKDYICKNAECPTQDKKHEDEKEAVFFRPKHSYEVTYVCCVCKKGWT